MMRNRIFLIALAIIIFSCNTKDTPSDFDYGKVEDDKYINSFFDFEIGIPSGWSVQSQQQLENLSKQGGELIAGDDKVLKATLKASEVNTANLLGVYQYELGSAVEYNPSFMIVAENTSNFPGIKNGSDYLFQAKKLLSQGQMPYEFPDAEFGRENFGGADFFAMNANMSYMGVNIRQTYYTSVIKGFSFSVIISYINDEQKEELLKTLKTMRFGKS